MQAFSLLTKHQQARHAGQWRLVWIYIFNISPQNILSNAVRLSHGKMYGNIFKWKQQRQFHFCFPYRWKLPFNPIALRRTKTLWSFGHSECNKVNGKNFPQKKGGKKALHVDPL